MPCGALNSLIFLSSSIKYADQFLSRIPERNRISRSHTRAGEAFAQRFRRLIGEIDPFLMIGIACYVALAVCILNPNPVCMIQDYIRVCSKLTEHPHKLPSNTASVIIYSSGCVRQSILVTKLLPAELGELNEISKVISHLIALKTR